MQGLKQGNNEKSKPIQESKSLTETSSPGQQSDQHSSTNRLLRSSGSVSAMTFLSRIFGLLRDLVFAQLIGAGAAADAFYVAFKIPNFFRRLFAEGAFNQAFVPVLSDYQVNHGQDQVRYLVSRVSGTLAVVLFAFCALVVIWPGLFTSLFAYGFRSDPEKFGHATHMLRITFPYLLLISLTGMAGAVLNAHNRFAIPAFTPVLLNVCLISSALFLAPRMDVPAYALAWGVLLAGVVQLLFQLPFLARMHMLPMPVWGGDDAGVLRVLKLMLPAIFGVSVSQINLLLDTLLASFLPTGSVSWLYYSDRLAELPLGVIAIAVATVILPNLSRSRYSESPQQFSQLLDWGLRVVVLIGVPAMLALMVLANPILATLFFYGEFSERDLMMSTISLRAYAAGLLAFMLIKVLAPGYYAREDMKTPVRIGVIAMLLNMLFNVILVAWLHFFHQVGHVGLALATSLSAAINAGLLLRGLRLSGSYNPAPGWLAFLARMVFGCGAMVAVILLMLDFWSGQWIAWNAWQRIWHLAAICLSGLLVFLLSLLLAGMRPRDLMRAR